MKKIRILLVLCFILCLSDSVKNSCDDNVELFKLNDKWCKYWYYQYGLSRHVDPVTNKRLTAKKVCNAGLAVGFWESDYNSNQIVYEPKVSGNSYGTYGLLSTTAKVLGWNGKDPKELLNPEINAKFSMKYFCEHLDKYEGNIMYAMAAYNAGRCRIRKGKIRNQYYVDNVYPIYVSYNHLRK